VVTASASETEMRRAEPVKPRDDHTIALATFPAGLADTSFGLFVELRAAVRHGGTFAEHIAISDGKKAER